MSSEGRRHLAAIVALVVGSFVGLTLLPVNLTGPIGAGLGGALWRGLGVGALGFPLLGLGLAFAGFDRFPGLDMKRVAILMIGLALLIPFIIGVVADVQPGSFGSTALAPRLTGVVPTFLSYYVVLGIGQAGGILLWFVLLSALTIPTIGWHPLRRLVRSDAAPLTTPVKGETSGGRRADSRKAEPAEDEEDEAPPVVSPRRAKKAKKPTRSSGAPIGDPTDETQLPPIDLLAPPPTQDRDAGEAELDRLGGVLQETLKTFKVDGRIAGRTTGPVVTQFEVVPAPGVKAGRIAALADDMAITMRAQSVRVAPIPGKGAVGVEIPNPTARMVTLRELLESGEWDGSKAVLPIALGRDLEGKAVVADLTKMPHLLIAGATGSGKSVAINTIITGLVYHYTPKQLRFLMVDPKMVELSMYNALPHLRQKVVTNNNDAALVLGWAVEEMNRRYELLHANSARNLADFNKKAEEGKPLQNPVKPQRPTLASISSEAETTAPETEEENVYRDGPLPLIVMIVDELADLMMTVQGEVERPLAMLAQKARAIGIHIILATQRPSVNVLTGLIKANFPSRIAFRVASKVDSRTILDQNGAEALLGNGDMLFLPPGKSEPMRIQGAFIATDETERVMDWFEERREARKVAGVPERRESDIVEVMRARLLEEESGGSGGFEGERDPLFRDAAEVCVQNQNGSTSLLQRRLSIGYGRAARIIDQLHMAGILSAQIPGSSKGREVLIGIDQIDEYCQ
jgi:DNA segregation ATPase FtsK/SpoIIIE, S-DNA-T family